MQSFLVIAKNKDEGISYVASFLKEKKIGQIDTNQNSYEKMAGIEDIRNIQKTILLKPFKGKEKAVIIQAYEGITLEAQNALLKVLEEPPANTFIVISVPTKEIILPTILSRCKIVALQEKESKLNEGERPEFENALETILEGSIGSKLRIAQDIARDKISSALWVEKMSLFLRDKLQKNSKDIKLLNLLKGLQQTYKTIKSTNVSHRAALENLFLSF